MYNVMRVLNVQQCKKNLWEGTEINNLWTCPAVGPMILLKTWTSPYTHTLYSTRTANRKRAAAQHILVEPAHIAHQTKTPIHTYRKYI
jgi:hypothetical protein